MRRFPRYGADSQFDRNGRQQRRKYKNREYLELVMAIRMFTIGRLV